MDSREVPNAAKRTPSCFTLKSPCPLPRGSFASPSTRPLRIKSVPPWKTPLSSISPNLNRSPVFEAFSTPLNRKFSDATRHTPASGRKLACASTSQKNVVMIPESPLMKRLGYGTGVGVYVLERDQTYVKMTPNSKVSGIPMLSPWAVKKVNTGGQQDRDKKEGLASKLYEKRLLVEAELLKSLRHPNIVGFRLLTKATDSSLCLCMEKLTCSLYDEIERRGWENPDVRVYRNEAPGSIPFTSKEVNRVALSVAKALVYLHNDMHILHADLKSGNVLISRDLEIVKVADFGCSVKLDKKLNISDPEMEYVGTEAWTPPEVIRDDREEEPPLVSEKADMWAFGMTIWEMLTLTTPYEYLDGDEYERALGTRPYVPRALEPSLLLPIYIFCICTIERPIFRPCAKQVLDFLSKGDEILHRLISYHRKMKTAKAEKQLKCCGTSSI